MLACFIKLSSFHTSFISSFLCHLFLVGGRQKKACMYMCVHIGAHTPASKIIIEKNVVRTPWLLPFIFPEKKKQIYKFLCAKRSCMTVQQFVLSFSFCTVILLSCISLSRTTSATTISYSRLSSTRAFFIRQSSPSCFPKQLRQVAISLSHLIRVHAFFPGSSNTGVRAE